jgi:hypothetical protein
MAQAERIRLGETTAEELLEDSIARIAAQLERLHPWPG